MLKILIADDHTAIRKGVKLILSTEFDEVEFGEASNVNEVFAKIKECNWDLLIMDMNMPGRDGLEGLKQLKESKSQLKTLIFSMHHETQMAVRALKLGAFGYLSKDAADGDLVKAVNVILSGKKYITPEVAELMVNQLGNPDSKPLNELLSDREYKTLLLFASGKNVSQIAEELFLSVSTVSTYRSRILEKMGMKNNAELVNFAIRNNLV